MGYWRLRVNPESLSLLGLNRTDSSRGHGETAYAEFRPRSSEARVAPLLPPLVRDPLPARVEKPVSAKQCGAPGGLTFAGFARKELQAHFTDASGFAVPVHETNGATAGVAVHRTPRCHVCIILARARRQP